jgi:hypothetical protein
LVKLNCINRTPVYSEHNKLAPRTFGLDRFHCYVHVILYQVLFENILTYLHVDKINICQKHCITLNYSHSKVQRTNSEP